MSDSQAPPLAEPVMVAQFFKGRARRDIVRVTLGIYKNIPIVDVRQFSTGTDGIVRPTKRGVAMAIRRLPELANAIEKAVREARSRGLLVVDHVGADR